MEYPPGAAAIGLLKAGAGTWGTGASTGAEGRVGTTAFGIEPVTSGMG